MHTCVHTCVRACVCACVLGDVGVGTRDFASLSRLLPRFFDSRSLVLLCAARARRGDGLHGLLALQQSGKGERGWGDGRAVRLSAECIEEHFEECFRNSFRTLLVWGAVPTAPPPPPLAASHPDTVKAVCGQ